jgi:peptide/nickel transport system substrate-binding protein
MKRRAFLQSAAAAMLPLTAPGLAYGAEARLLKFIPQADLAILDPIWTTAYVTRNHGFLVFDTLFGIDGQFRPQLQMLESAGAESDGLLWRLRLRDGLKFHDGTPVLARDCVASIRRWGARDAFGQALLAATDELTASDDRSIVFRLKRPFPLLPDALGKASSNLPAMMPERLAKTDPFTAITDMIGSGPYRFKADERVPGSLVVYERFADYRPRDSGTPDWIAGPKIAHFDRIEWHVVPDSATASAALQSGEVDWWEQPTFDLLPLLKGAPEVTIEQIDPTGFPSMARFNQLWPPFDNPAIRRALLGCVSETDEMTAVAGTDSHLWRADLGFFPPASPMASTAGTAILQGPRDYDKVKRDLAAAGYKGERVVAMIATDFPVLNAMGVVGADMLKRAGMNVDVLATDWGTVVQRRAKKDSPEKGGWSVFFTSFSGLDQFTPASYVALRGNGQNAWFGWPTAPKLEELRDQWFAAPDLAAQKKICEQIQLQAFVDVPFLPLGLYYQPTAHRKNVTDLLKGLPIFWNVRKG